MKQTQPLTTSPLALQEMIEMVHGQPSSTCVRAPTRNPANTTLPASAPSAKPTVSEAKTAPRTQVASVPKNKTAMKNISVIRGKDDNVSYRVQIRRRVENKNISVCESFPDVNSAQQWRDQQLALLGAGILPTKSQKGKTIADCIRYRKDKHKKKVGRTAKQVLNFLEEHPFAKMRVRDLTEEKLIQFAEALIAKGMSPQTTASYMSILAYTLKWVRRKNWDVPQHVVEEAMEQLWDDEILERSNERERVAQRIELDEILSLAYENKRQKLPVITTVLFALYSTRRLGEICRLRWDDLRADRSEILVREMKHPRKKKKYHRWVKLTPEALAIIQAMPRNSEFIFPWNPKSLGTAFQRHRDKAEIMDLHFHDLRHTGITRLFELGETAPFVMLHSGHKNSDTLDRYTHVEEKHDRFQDWIWLERVVAAAKAGCPI